MHAPLDMKLIAEWRPLASLAAETDGWRDLAARALEPNVFYAPAFALPAARALAPDVQALVISAREAPGKLLGLFPARMGRRRYGGLVPLLEGWAHAYGPLGTPLIDRDCADAVLAAWLSHLARDTARPALMLLPLVPQSGAFAAALDRALLRHGARQKHFGRHRRALLAPAGDRSGYLDAAINPKMRKELRRQRRRLGDLGPLAHEALTGAEEIAAALDEFLALEAAGWKGRAGTAIAQAPHLRAFVADAVRALAREGKVRIERLAVSGRPVASVIALRCASTMWAWKTAYDESLARHSPGAQAMLALTQALLADPGVARADSTAAPDHPMIDRIWRERLALSDRLILLRPSAAPLFALACGMETVRRAALALVKAARRRR